MIPFVALKAQYESIREELETAALAALASTQYVLGEEVAAFEEEFARYSGAKYGIAVNSGTSALHLALLAADIGRGDEVISVSSTFIATVAAIDYTGARPVFVDIDPVTLTMDPALIEAAITKHTKAILPVHLHGLPADMDPILEIAQRHGLRVIGDAAQAHGAKYKGRGAGSIGDLGCFSFYPGKNLGACGEGGMVVTNDSDFANMARMLRDWGQEKKYHHVLKGFNYRMDGVQGAILRVKLRYLEDWTEARRSHAALYNELLKDSGIKTPVEPSYARHVYHVYGIRTPHRDNLQQLLQENSIQSGIHYPIPVHMQKAYREFSSCTDNLAVTEQVAEELLSLPMFPELQDTQIEETSAVLLGAKRC